MSKVGRNDLCPCGSGRKFKKCCQVLEPSTPPVHWAHDVDRRLVVRLSRLLDAQPETWMRAAAEEYGRPAEEAEGWMFPLFFYHYRGPEDDEPTLLERLLERGLPEEERMLAEAQGRAHASYWRMEEVRDGRLVLMRDLLLDETRWVHDVGLTESFRPGLTLLCRILDLPEACAMIGAFPRPLPPLLADRARQEFLDENPVVDKELLRTFDGILDLEDFWLHHVDEMDHAGPPRLTNFDGHEVVLIRDRLAFPPESRAHVVRRLAEIEGFQWTEPGQSGHFTTPGGQIAAFVELQDKALILQANSVERADALNERILALGIPGLRRQRRDKKDALVPQGMKPPSDVPPEVLRQIRRQLDERWLEEKIPALDGLTPRQAAAVPDMRSRLDALLLEIQGHDRESSEFLRRELGMELSR